MGRLISRRSIAAARQTPSTGPLSHQFPSRAASATSADSDDLRATCAAARRRIVAPLHVVEDQHDRRCASARAAISSTTAPRALARFSPSPRTPLRQRK
jgi:hypothetical protein